MSNLSALSPVEAQLLARVKEYQDSGALTQLIDMHTGIYYQIAAKYSRAYPDVIKINDIDDDRMTNMYKWIINYNPEKKMKLGSYIGEQTDYMCKHILQKEEHNPLSPYVTAALPSGDGSVLTNTFSSSSYDSEAIADTLPATTAGYSVSLVDNTSSAYPADAAHAGVAMNDIMKIVDDPANGIDSRFKYVLKCRLAEPPQSWRQIGPALGVSHEMARKVYNRGIYLIKKKVNYRSPSLKSVMEGIL